MNPPRTTDDGKPRAAPLRAFPPVARADAGVLVLGSMPGIASLRAHAYYAHPRNAFWPIMGELLGAGPALPYPERLARLNEAGIALWDVVAECERSGSLDSAIRIESVRANPFAQFLRAHPRIGVVLFNGAQAERLFLRLVAPTLGGNPPNLHRLPSTSPANASVRFDGKLAAWRAGLRAAGIAIK